VTRLVATIFSIFSKEQLWQAAQGNCSDESCQADYVPTIRTKRNYTKTVQETDNCHSQKEGAGQVTVHSPATSRIGQARDAHYAQRGCPNRSAPASTDVAAASCDNRDNWKAKQNKTQPGV
jgi:hypothetical protein